MKDIFFYWSGEEPKQSFNDVKRYFPTAKFIEYKDNPVATALITSKKSLTKQFWLMDIDYLIANSIKNLDLPEWDQSYTHVFSNDVLNAYLVPKHYTYSPIEIDSGIFENKKIVETSEVYYRPYEMYFYWSGVEPTHKITELKKLFPTAKFIEKQSTIISVANVLSKSVLTDFYWLVDIDLVLEKELAEFRVPEWDHQYVHVFNNDKLSAYLIPLKYNYDTDKLEEENFKNKKIIETSGINYRPYDLYFYWAGTEPTHKINALKDLYPSAKFVKRQKNPVNTSYTITGDITTDMFWLVDIDLVISKNLCKLRVPEWDHKYTQVFVTDDRRAYLVPKKYSYDHAELVDGHFTNKKIVEDTDIQYRPYDLYFYWAGTEPTHKIKELQKLYPSAKFVKRQKNSVNTSYAITEGVTTDMFWLVDIDLVISDKLQNLRVPEWDHKYTQVFVTDDRRAYLVPKKYSYDHAEIIDGHFTNKKIVEDAGVTYRPYDLFFYWTGIEPTHKFEGVKQLYPSAKFVKRQKNPVNTAKTASENSTTDMFWLVDIELVMSTTLREIHVPEWDHKYVQVYVNDTNRAYLIPFKYQYDHVETIDGHFTNKKMIETNDVYYRPYDIFFLSYDEEHADTNW